MSNWKRKLRRETLRETCPSMNLLTEESVRSALSPSNKASRRENHVMSPQAFHEAKDAGLIVEHPAGSGEYVWKAELEANLEREERRKQEVLARTIKELEDRGLSPTGRTLTAPAVPRPLKPA